MAQEFDDRIASEIEGCVSGEVDPPVQLVRISRRDDDAGPLLGLGEEIEHCAREDALTDDEDRPTIVLHRNGSSSFLVGTARHRKRGLSFQKGRTPRAAGRAKTSDKISQRPQA